MKRHVDVFAFRFAVFDQNGCDALGDFAILRFCSGVRPSTQVICTCGMEFLLGFSSSNNPSLKTEAF